ncbi:NADPH-dependent FMN reductase [uncultured Vibrio sp.]|uniref:NADPH-dependent FMN reductase n=1 Tax=uncultured Vibrio sp. TaxID=114054 RepID=UPI0009171E7F|nr:NADPH-dependent FMN reductase [uncultured Vibrio sp.]OIQ25615.1 MAG: NADPH-dependent FMN reductase [Vibrio sp. MedPE-SWchi]
MKVIAFGASTSSTSINKALATYSANLIEEAEVKVLDISNYNVPIFSEDTEKEIGQAEGAQAFLRDLAEADAFVISFAEHNGHYPAAYKNLFDWATRIERSVFGEKPAVYLATSPGPGGAQTVLGAAVGSAPYFGGNVKASVSVPSFYDKFDFETSTVTDEAIAEQIKQAVALLN